MGIAIVSADIYIACLGTAADQSCRPEKVRHDLVADRERLLTRQFLGRTLFEHLDLTESCSWLSLIVRRLGPEPACSGIDTPSPDLCLQLAR